MQFVDVVVGVPVIMQRRSDQAEASLGSSSGTENTVEFPMDSVH